MKSIRILEREMTAAEFARLNAGMQEHAPERGHSIQTSERYGLVVLDGETFIGCAAGLAYKDGLAYSPWFYLSDLFIEKAYRGQGLGAAILRRLEERIAVLGIDGVWTWTAGYEAPGFYKKQGYQVFCEQENHYFTGHSRIGLRKAFEPSCSSSSHHAPSSPDVHRGDRPPLRFLEREMTQAELDRMNAGFDEHSIEHGNPIEAAERYGFVALDGERFIGAVSGLAYKSDRGYNAWFSITDLFLEQAYRGQGHGAAMLQKLEERAATLGVSTIWTWTSDYEAPGFYQLQGYEVCCELENGCSAGHSQVGLRKRIS